ncbi:MAG: hypothetical protein ACE5IK_07000 [Acidobacteriota bacterium]
MRTRRMVPLLTILVFCAGWGVLPVEAGPQLGGAEIGLMPGDGGGSGTASLTFSVGGVELVPGGTSHVDIDLAGSAEVASGSLLVQFNPPVFVQTPTLGLTGSPNNLVLGIDPVGAGIYRVDFSAPTALLLQTGQFVRLTGVAEGALAAGSAVSVQVSASAVPAGTDPVEVNSFGASLTVSTPADALQLRVSNGKDLVPGSIVLVEIRTYNPKPISEGQVCFQFSTAFFSSVSSVQVFAAEPDVSFTSDTTTPGVVAIQFSSPTASVNRLDGSMILVEMIVSPTVPPGASTTIIVDAAQSSLLDDAGASLAISSRSGTFTVLK